MAAPLINLGVNLWNQSKEALSQIDLKDVDNEKMKQAVFAKNRFKSFKSGELAPISTKTLRSLSWTSLQEVKNTLMEQIDTVRAVQPINAAPGLHLPREERKQLKKSVSDIKHTEKKILKLFTKIQKEEKNRYKAINALLKWNKKEKDVWNNIYNNRILKTAYNQYRKETYAIHGMRDYASLERIGELPPYERKFVMLGFYKLLDDKLLKGEISLKDVESLARNKKYINIPEGHVRHLQRDVHRKENSRQHPIRVFFRALVKPFVP